jgi:hypothetical protein
MLLELPFNESETIAILNFIEKKRIIDDLVRLRENCKQRRNVTFAYYGGIEPDFTCHVKEM